MAGNYNTTRSIKKYKGGNMDKYNLMGEFFKI